MRFARASRVGAATAWLGPCSVEEMPRLLRPASVGRTEADPLAHPLGRRGHATVPAAPCEHGPHADRAAPDGPDAVQGGFPISIAPVKPYQSLNMIFHENLLLGFFWVRDVLLQFVRQCKVWNHRRGWGVGTLR